MTQANNTDATKVELGAAPKKNTNMSTIITVGLVLIGLIVAVTIIKKT